MIRRFAAAILTLVMLLCVFPVSSRAAENPAYEYRDCRVYVAGEKYELDEYVWVKGRSNALVNTSTDIDIPEGLSVNWKWEKIANIVACGDGYWEEHEHNSDCEDFIYEEKLICNQNHEHDNDCYKTIATPFYKCNKDVHVHNYVGGCMGRKGLYLHHVYDVDAGTTSPDTPNTTPSDVDDGYDEEPGNLHFEVLCVNAKGEPLPYVSFGIATAKTDAAGNIQYDSHSGAPLMENAIAFKTTNSEGKLRFNALENYMATSFQPWILYQDAAAFIKTDNATGRYYNQYYNCDRFWRIFGGLNFAVVKETSLEQEMPVINPEYNNGVLTYVNERIKCALDINVNFVDDRGNSISPSSCTVTVTPDKNTEGYPKQISFPLDQSSRNDYWGDTIYDIPVGKYTVESDEPAPIEGYGYYKTTYQLLVGSKWEEASTVDLGTDLTFGQFYITHHYVQGIAPDRVRVITQNEEGIGQFGATYVLRDQYEELCRFDNEPSVFEITKDDILNLDLVSEGEMITVWLEQKIPPEYYQPAAQRFEINITMENGDITMELWDEDGNNPAWDGLQTAVFNNFMQDLSNFIVVQATDMEQSTESENMLPGGKYVVYENGEAFKSYDLDGENSLVIGDFITLDELGSPREFELVQTEAPEGYLISEERFTITVTKENDATNVTLSRVEQAPGLGEWIASVFGMRNIEKDMYGRQVAQFHNEKAPSNTIIMKAYDGETEIQTPAVYVLKTASGNVLPPEIKDGMLDMSIFDARPDETLVFELEQIEAPEGYELDKNKFILTLHRTGDTIWTTIAETNGDGSNIVSGPEAQIVKFQNKKKPGTTKISLFLADNVVEWPEDGAEDTQYLDDLKNRAYEYVLEWSYDGSGGEEARMVKPNERVEFERELPLGAEYKIRPGKNFEDAIKTGLTGKSEGVVTEMQLYKVTNVTATHTYKIVAGNYAPELQLIKVDAADPQKVLPGATFALRGPDGKVFMQVTSDANGIIDISEALAEPAVHVMLETEAPAGYEKLSDYVEIRVEYDYTPATVDGEKVFVQNLNATATHPDAVEEIDGKYYIKNKLRPGDAKIHLTMDVQNPSWGKGTKTDTSYLKNEYSFLLSWQDANGKKQTEVLSLSTKNGKNQGTFKTSIPVGTEYKIAPIGDNIIYNAIFTGNGIAQSGTGTVNSSEDVNVVATLQHTFVAGKYKPEVYMLKVNAKNFNRTLAGAKFSLKDETGVILKTYLTQKDGAIELVDVLDDYPTSYTLTEIAAPEEYVKLKKAISIDLEYEYVPRRGTDGKITATQNLVARVHHDNVEQGSDGWYYIKNSHTSDIPQTGDAFNPVFWTGLLTISAAGIAVLLTTTRRRRKVR